MTVGSPEGTHGHKQCGLLRVQLATVGVLLDSPLFRRQKHQPFAQESRWFACETPNVSECLYNTPLFEVHKQWLENELDRFSLLLGFFVNAEGLGQHVVQCAFSEGKCSDNALDRYQNIHNITNWGQEIPALRLTDFHH